LLIKAYHAARGEAGRNKLLVPDSAHGTNPATGAMADYQVVTIPSGPDGCVDMDALKAAVGGDTAGLMLTNPNTLGLFDRNILDITRIVHEAGGLNYYDGANLNPIMGVVRPGDMGFDVVHLNLHKTFSTPHGGGGPGSGPVGCKAFLAPFLPASALGQEPSPQSIGQVRAFYGNFLVAVRALTYILTLGREGIREAAEHAVLNANYMLHHLRDVYPLAYDHPCMHEFVLTLEDLKKETGVSALDVAKALLDKGMHPPTMYFPLVVREALMVEPTETESRETLDKAIEAFLDIARKARENPKTLQECPVTTPIGRPDEVAAARNPRLRYAFPEGASPHG
jgi:glycine dehydrogenase subunit 2